jgi:hypothetical protein
VLPLSAAARGGKNRQTHYTTEINRMRSWTAGPDVGTVQGSYSSDGPGVTHLVCALGWHLHRCLELSTPCRCLTAAPLPWAARTRCALCRRRRRMWRRAARRRARGLGLIGTLTDSCGRKRTSMPTARRRLRWSCRMACQVRCKVQILSSSGLHPGNRVPVFLSI